MNVLKGDREKERKVSRISRRWRPEYVSDLVAARRKPAPDLQTGKSDSFQQKETLPAHKKRVGFKTNFFRLNIKHVINH